jgi:DNA/RNA endonuclease YhcR with UshA esterase domain
MGLDVAEATHPEGDSAGTPFSNIGDVRWRQRVRVRGRIKALRVQPWEGGVATLECTLIDGTGGITVIFMGRSKIGGIHLGSVLEIEGMVIESRGRLAVMNPSYTLLPVSSSPL